MKKRKLKKEDFFSFVLALVFLAGGLSLGANADKIYYWFADLFGVEVEEENIEDQDNDDEAIIASIVAG
jgi:hypothetical protein